MRIENLLLRKLELFGALDDADKQLLDQVVRTPRKVASHKDIIRQGEAPDVHRVVDEFLYRFKVLRNGDRQIFAYLVPGDFCDLNIFILKEMNHSIATLTPSQVVDIPRARVLELFDRPRIVRALWWATLVDEATLREWVVNLGQRDAEERIAHYSVRSTCACRGWG